MDIKTSEEFVARGDLLQNNISIPAMVIGSYSILEPDPVHCKVIPETGNFSGFSNLWDHSKIIEFRGTLENGNEIWISNFRVNRTGSVRDTQYFEGSAELFIESREGTLGEFDVSGRETTCYAVVPPTPFALSHIGHLYDHDNDGTIKLSEKNVRKGICWETPLGSAELIDNYSYIYDQRVGIHEAEVRLQICTVTIKVETDSTTSLKSILINLPGALDDAFFLLSFLGRKRIGWYKAEVISHLQDETHYAVARRRQFLGYESEWHKNLSWFDLLIPQKTLREGLFQKLLANYQKSSLRNTIDQTVLYLFGTYEEAYFESKLGIAYTALECLVAGMRTKGDDEINCFIDKKSFGLLAAKVNKIISEQVSDPETASKLINKFKNARQNSFIDRLWKLLKKYDVDIAKLWPDGVDLTTELARLIRRRNSYIHQGKVDEDKAYEDLVRLRGIVELWILKLLDCPDSEINTPAFREVRR